METWYPNAKRLPISTGEYWQNRGMPILAICDHITAGTDSRSFLQNANNGSSTHFLVRVENGVGVVYQFMPLEWAAWGNGITSGIGNPYMPQWIRDKVAAGVNPNLFTVSIEHEGVTPTAEMYTGPMLEATTALQKWLCETVGTIEVDRDHIIGHYQLDHLRKVNCPGGPGGALYPFDTIIAAIKAPAPVGDTYTDPVTGFSVSHGFLVYWKDHPSLGHPLSNEESGDSAPWNALPELQGFVCQMFERGALAWKMGWPVVEVRVGALALALAA